MAPDVKERTLYIFFYLNYHISICAWVVVRWLSVGEDCVSHVGFQGTVLWRTITCKQHGHTLKNIKTVRSVAKLGDLL